MPGGASLEVAPFTIENVGGDDPLSKSDALTLLGRLQEKLSEKERARREKAFEKAGHYIQNAEDGIDAPFKKSFFDDRKNRSIRVDIEILAGKAFVGLFFLVILLFFLKCT